MTIANVEERVKLVEATLNQATGALSLIKWIGAPLIPLVIFGWGYLYTSISALQSQATATNMKIDHLEKSVDRLERALDRLAEKVDRRITHTNLFSTEGLIKTISEKELVIDTNPPNSQEITFKLEPITRYVVMGKSGKLTDLKKGMRVRVLEIDDGVAMTVETIDNKP